jgi:hypothetical protein
MRLGTPPRFFIYRGWHIPDPMHPLTQSNAHSAGRWPLEIDTEKSDQAVLVEALRPDAASTA